jgi:ribonuclease HI
MPAPLAPYSIVFDGGSLGNPGRGYGSFRIRQADAGWAEPVRLEYGDRVTNNEAEYRSLMAAIAHVSRASDPKAVALEVFGDSLLVIRHLKGEWRVKAPNLVPLYLETRQALSGFGRVRLHWHRREESVRLLGH